MNPTDTTPTAPPQPQPGTNPISQMGPEPAPKPKQRTWLFIVLALVVILLAAAIAYSLSRTPQAVNTSTNSDTTTNSTEVIMIVRYVGGLCPDSKTCSTEYKLFGDGTFEGRTKLSSSELKQLKEVINNTDFLQYKDNPNPACPSFSDGQDEVLVFPQKYPDKSFTVCELEIPSSDTAISTINGLIEAHKK